MFTELENGIGLEIVVWLQSMGSGFLDTLAIVLDSLGGDVGYLLILPILYWSINRQYGRQLLVVLLVGLVGLLAFKELFARPRPYLLHPDLVRGLTDEDGYGIPSGHVIVSMMIFGYLGTLIRRTWFWVLTVIYVALIGWARMYAGLHYPQDVILAIPIGLLLLWLSLRYGDDLLRLYDRIPALIRVAAIIVISLTVALLFGHDETALTAAGLILGSGIALIAEAYWVRFNADGTVSQRVIRSLIGLVLLIVVFFGLRVAFSDLEPDGLWRVIRYAISAAFALFVYPLIMVRVGLAKTDPRVAVTQIA